MWAGKTLFSISNLSWFQFNYVRLRAILEAVKSLDAGSKLPIVIGEQRGRLGNMYVLDLKLQEETTPMEVEKPEKSVHWADIGRPGVESQTAIPPFKKQRDTSQGVILMIVAAALVAVTVLR